MNAVIATTLGRYLLVIFRPIATDKKVVPFIRKYSFTLKAPINFIEIGGKTYMGCINIDDGVTSPQVSMIITKQPALTALNMRDTSLTIPQVVGSPIKVASKINLRSKPKWPLPVTRSDHPHFDLYFKSHKYSPYSDFELVI
jgi:hypothetical protein